MSVPRLLKLQELLLGHLPVNLELHRWHRRHPFFLWTRQFLLQKKIQEIALLYPLQFLPELLKLILHRVIGIDIELVEDQLFPIFLQYLQDVKD